MISPHAIFHALVRLLPLIFLFCSCADESNNNELWVGKWTVESIDGGSVDSILIGPESAKTIEVTNEITFKETHSWFWDLGSVFDSQGVDGTTDQLEIFIRLNGTYRVDGERFSLSPTNVTAKLSPLNIWQEEVGITENDVEKSIRNSFAAENRGVWRLESRKLILDGDKSLWNLTQLSAQTP